MKDEVQFNPDERTLLELLQGKVKIDHALTISDTALIRALGWEEKRFFVAKGHLLCAGALAMYRDGNGHQCLRLLMPERPHRASKRYVFTVLPLEMVERVRAMVAAERQSPIARPAQNAGSSPSVPGKPSKPLPRRDFQRAQERGQQGLGVSPVPQRPGRFNRRPR